MTIFLRMLTLSDRRNSMGGVANADSGSCGRCWAANSFAYHRRMQLPAERRTGKANPSLAGTPGAHPPGTAYHRPALTALQVARRTAARSALIPNLRCTVLRFAILPVLRSLRREALSAEESLFRFSSAVSSCAPFASAVADSAASFRKVEGRGFIPAINRLAQRATYAQRHPQQVAFLGFPDF